MTFVYTPRNVDFVGSLLSGLIGLALDRDFVSPEVDDCGNVDEVGFEYETDECGKEIITRKKTYSNIFVRSALVQYTIIFIARNISANTNVFDRPENELFQEVDIWTGILAAIYKAVLVYRQAKCKCNKYNDSDSDSDSDSDKEECESDCEDCDECKERKEPKESKSKCMCRGKKDILIAGVAAISSNILARLLASDKKVVFN